ncbi:fructosamine kinase family protein [Secundilactobacillus kimchicus]|nr:fructosamine kinase family protein [Secundilactobacillus kimchicus]
MLSDEFLAQLPLSGISAVQPVSGGDINQAFRVVTRDGPYFLLVQPDTPQSFYAHEVEGLNLIGQVARVPQVIATGDIAGDAYLILEWLDSGQGQQADLGRLVATMHAVHNDQFGFDHDVLTGKLPKYNTWQTNWGDFFVNQRLNVLAKRASQSGLWSASRQQHLDQLTKKILAYYQDHPSVPSLLHGDLWAGNYMFTKTGEPALIDPDVFYGDREFDIAVTTVFGGFSRDFYTAYQQQYPLPAGYEDRLPWYQLYYLMAHLNLFGESYGGAVDRILMAN